jgi:hypothetical protein
VSPLGPIKGVDIDGGANTALVTTAETVVATVVIGSDTPEGDQIILEGVCQVTTGTATTSVQLRVRRNGVAGPQVGGTAQQGCSAAAPCQISTQVDDTPGEVASQTYVLTAQQVAATGNGTAVWANLQATY